ncbi:MAG TPA: hypothetical protein VFQ07_10590, partial [Candidatus Polarisedimenticolia bacterium]|nr:hypothetical protein [Candidatus Polarisedimenticolia bacterium]
MAEARTLRRLRRLERRLGARPALRRLVGVLARLVAAAPTSLRRRVLHGPDLRGFLSEAETWCDMLDRSRPGAPPDRLFDLVARTEHLTALVPKGRLDSGFPARARRLAMLKLRGIEGEAAALIL